MEFEVTHTTHYRYSQPAAEAYGEARLTPPSLPSQTVLSHKLALNPIVRTSSYDDHFHNRVDFFSLPFRHQRLVITNQVVVRTHPVARPVDALDVSIQEARQIFDSALTDIFDYLQPTPVVETGKDAVAWARKYLRGDRPLGLAIQELNEAIHREFQYESGATENSTPLGTVWRMRKGVCQDFAHIGLSILRTAGLPARYVCGYIETDPPKSADGRRQLTGSVATHAWIEVLAPGMQWVAIDPTNRQWTDERYIAVSFGRDYRDASPLRGTFKGSGGQTMRIRVKMKRRNGEREIMKVQIQYDTAYKYTEKVTFSPHLFRLIPKMERWLKVSRFDFTTNRDGVVNWRRDVFDNEVASVFYPKAAKVLEVHLRLNLELQEKNAFGFLLESYALNFPFEYRSNFRAVLAPYMSEEPMPPMPFWNPPTDNPPTVDMLVGLNSAINRSLAYERREEGAARSAAETLALGSGACRDFSVLLVGALRGMGLAARYTSGYLCEFGETEKRAEGALHAWVETYLPGAGWIGLDPTNGTLCDHHHLTAAVGIAPADVAPIEGNYYHARSVPHEMTSSLKITPQ